MNLQVRNYLISNFLTPFVLQLQIIMSYPAKLCRELANQFVLRKIIQNKGKDTGE